MLILRQKMRAKPDKSDELMARARRDHHSGASHGGRCRIRSPGSCATRIPSSRPQFVRTARSRTTGVTSGGAQGGGDAA